MTSDSRGMDKMSFLTLPLLLCIETMVKELHKKQNTISLYEAKGDPYPK